MTFVLPADALTRAQEIADSAPPVSDAKLVRLGALLRGTQADIPVADAA
jgi:hypothetical protein